MTSDQLFNTLRLANEAQYQNYRNEIDPTATEIQRIIARAAHDGLAEAVLMAELTYRNAGRECPHHFVNNEHGDILCTNCRKFNALLTLASKINDRHKVCHRPENKPEEP